MYGETSKIIDAAAERDAAELEDSAKVNRHKESGNKQQ